MISRLAVAAIAASVASACSGPQAFTQRDEDAIRAVIAAQSAAWNRGDLEGFMAGYARTPELVFTSGGTIERGWAETLARYRSRYGDDTASMGKLAFEVLEVRPLGAGGAVVLGTWALSDGPRTGRGVFSLAFERRPEGWRVVHDHTSVTPADDR